MSAKTLSIATSLAVAFCVASCGSSSPSGAGQADAPAGPDDTAAPQDAAPADVGSAPDADAADTGIPPSDTGDAGRTADASDGTTSEPGQRPPTTGGADLEAWLAKGFYKSWRCEPAVHENRSPSPHGFNRICSNDALSGWKAKSEFPVGAASVKELHDDLGSTKPTGYAVAVHVKAGAAEGWYWYEKGEADGLGDMDPAKSGCVSCHQLAGTAPRYSGHDLVFTQVR